MKEVLIIEDIKTKTYFLSDLCFSFLEPLDHRYAANAIVSVEDIENQKLEVKEVPIQSYTIDNKKYHIAINPFIKDKVPLLRLIEILQNERDYFKELAESYARDNRIHKNLLSKFENSKIIKFLQFIKVL